MTHKNLPHMRRIRQLTDHCQCIRHITFQSGIAAVLDGTAGIERHIPAPWDGLIAFLLALGHGRLGIDHRFARAKPAKMIIHLKRHPQRIHMLVAFPAIGLLRDSHPVAEGAMRFIRQHRVDRDREIRNGSAQEPLSNPFPAQNRVVIRVLRESHQPARLREDAHSLPGGQLHRLGGIIRALVETVGLAGVALQSDRVG